MKKTGLISALLISLLVTSTVPKDSVSAKEVAPKIKDAGSCTMVIDKNKHTGEHGNFAEASGVCKGFEQGVYSKQGKQYVVMGAVTQVIKNGQKVKMSTPYTDGEATLTVYTTTKSPAVKKSAVKVSNAKGSKDQITISKVKKNDTIRIYKDSKKKKLLYTAKAKSSTLKFTNKKLSSKGGNLYVTLKRPYLKESSITKISYKAEK